MSAQWRRLIALLLSLALLRAATVGAASSKRHVHGLQMQLHEDGEATAARRAAAPRAGASKLCYFCQVSVHGLHNVWEREGTRRFVEALFDRLCAFADLNVPRVCYGIGAQFRDEVIYVLGRTVVEPHQICGLLLADCGRPGDPLNANWTIELPGDKPPVYDYEHDLPPDTASSNIRVLHLSDIHFDPYYAVGSRVDCDEPLCCRSAPTDADRNNSTLAGKWISMGKCDIPMWTVRDLFKRLGREKFDYIVWTGDLMPHDVWNVSRARNVHMLANLTRMWHEHFGNTPVYSAVGNHESAPVDSFPPNELEPPIPAVYRNNWLYNALWNQWKVWIGQSNENDVKQRASYSQLVKPGFRIISINTQYCYETNFWLYVNATDPDRTLEWLVDELCKAERAQEKVHIIGHVPTGDEACLAAWSRNYYRIVQRFESTIRGQFYGHTHHDSFAVQYSTVGGHHRFGSRPVGVQYVAPSVTSYRDVAPAYRVYTVDGRRTGTWAVLDHHTYAMDVAETHRRDTPVWQLEYTAKSAYGLRSLTPKRWDRLIDRMHNTPWLMDAYIRRYTRRPTGQFCNWPCRKAHLCEMRAGRSGAQPLFCNDL